MQTGDLLPEFDLPTVEDQRLSDKDFRGHWSVIYFYPKDSTPGCTKEAVEFSSFKAEIDALGAKIAGVSKDSPRRHANFISKQELTIDLISDEEGKLCEAFGVWVEKKNYGRTYMGIERSTFLFAPDGKLHKVWRKVRVAGHAEDVISTLRSSVNNQA
ncbi:MAG: peroxiredoxin [Ponticaulis sp.]|nr:peroxiredoxin [Ponticaulis sp.]